MSTKKPKTKCCAEVWPGGSMRPARCSRNARVTVDGKPYCSQHDPVKAAEKRKAQAAEQEARNKLWAWEKQRQALMDKAYNVLLSPGYNYDNITVLKDQIQRHERKKPGEK